MCNIELNQFQLGLNVVQYNYFGIFVNERPSSRCDESTCIPVDSSIARWSWNDGRVTAGVALAVDDDTVWSGHDGWRAAAVDLGRVELRRFLLQYDRHQTSNKLWQ